MGLTRPRQVRFAPLAPLLVGAFLGPVLLWGAQPAPGQAAKPAPSAQPTSSARIEARPGRGAAEEPPTPFQTPEIHDRFLDRWSGRIEEAVADAETIPVPPDPFLPPDIRDPVFGYLIGMLDRERFGVVTGEHLRVVSEVSGRKPRVPIEMIESVTSVSERERPVLWTRAQFTEDLRLPVPYSLLGYHPGRLISSAAVTAREWRVPLIRVPHPVGDETLALEIEDATLFAFVSGHVEMDIDGWVDRLLGSGLDDTKMIGLAVFRFQGVRYSMALGYNDKGEPRSGALDLETDEVRFPTPPELKSIARHVRQLLVKQLADMGLPPALPPPPR